MSESPPVNSAECDTAESASIFEHGHKMVAEVRASAALRKSMAKSRKTADELRDMILDRARENPVFPPGMSVHIRRIRTSWGIDCVPPTISKAAHTDCCDLLISIANQLREEYDLESPDQAAVG